MFNSFDVKKYQVDLTDFLPKPNIPVCLPGDKEFMIEKGSAFHAYLLLVDNQWFVVDQNLVKASDIKGIKKVTLFKGIFEIDQSLFLHPVTWPEKGKATSWFDSWQLIVKKAETHWLKSRKVKDEQLFRATVVKNLDPPEWPNWTMEQCVAIAFDKKHIDSADHPLIEISPKKSSSSRPVIEDEDDFEYEFPVQTQFEGEDEYEDED